MATADAAPLQSVFWEQVQTTGEVPEPRSGHSFTSIGGRFLLFGGAGTKNGTCWARAGLRLWQAVRAVPSFTCPFFLIPHTFAGKARALNDLYEYESGEDEAKWTVVTCSHAPPPRARHMAVELDANRMLIFGGIDKRTRYDDLWLFDLPSKSWTQIEAQGHAARDADGNEVTEFPGARAHFTATRFFDKIFIFGGYGGAGVVFGDLWVLHIEEGGTFR